MSGYYSMKTRYFVIQLAKGVSLIGISICIAAAIAIEMMQKYDSNSRMAYVIGLAICAFIIAGGVFLCLQAFHFDRAMLGRKKEDYALLQKELAQEDSVAIHDLIVTNHFVMIYTKQFSGFCRMVRMKDIIACFENPVYGTVEKINDYTITLYDKKFERYQIVLDGDAVEEGHRGVEKIYALRPWIIRENLGRFEEGAATAAGRRALIKELERAKRGEDAPAETETEIRPEAPAETEIRPEAPARKTGKKLLSLRKKKDK